MAGIYMRDRDNKLRKPIRRKDRKQREDGGDPEPGQLHPMTSLQPDVDHQEAEHEVRGTPGPEALVGQVRELLMAQKETMGQAYGPHVTTSQRKNDDINMGLGQSVKSKQQIEADRRQLRSLKQRLHIIQELEDTETDYVTHLGDVVHGYVPRLKDGPLSEGVQKIIFGNILQIYEWHKRTVSAELSDCGAKPERIGRLFVRWKNQFTMYVKYCENWPKSEYLVSEHSDIFDKIRREMGSRLGIADLLIKPVQRITKYHLLMKDLLKHSERAGDDTKDLMRAVEVMRKVPKEANDMMSVARLEGFPGKIMAQGRLLFQDILQVAEQTSTAKGTDHRFSERRVYLFEQSVIFAEQIDKKKKMSDHSNPRYIFKNYIMTNNMGFNERGTGEPFTFTIIDRKQGLRYHLQAPDVVVHANWKAELTSIIDMVVMTKDVLSNPMAHARNTEHFGDIF